MRGVNIPSFQANCPACKKSVSAFLVQGSLENLRKNEGDVRLGHPTNDPHVGDHIWILTDPEAKARLRKLISKST
jgi:hypothetical protein